MWQFLRLSREQSSALVASTTPHRLSFHSIRPGDIDLATHGKCPWKLSPPPDNDAQSSNCRPRTDSESLLTHTKTMNAAFAQADPVKRQSARIAHLQTSSHIPPGPLPETRAEKGLERSCAQAHNKARNESAHLRARRSPKSPGSRRNRLDGPCQNRAFPSPAFVLRVPILGSPWSKRVLRRNDTSPASADSRQRNWGTDNRLLLREYDAKSSFR